MLVDTECTFTAAGTGSAPEVCITGAQGEPADCGERGIKV